MKKMVLFVFVVCLVVVMIRSVNGLEAGLNATFACFDSDKYGCGYDCSLNPNNKTDWTIENHLGWLYYQDCHNKARIIILEQNCSEERISKIEDDLFENESGGGMTIRLLDKWGCIIENADTMHSNKTKDKIKQLKYKECVDRAMINEAKQNLTTLQLTIQTIQDTLSDVWGILTGHTTRIENLENQTYPSMNLTHPYFEYLRSSDRKRIVCGYAEDNRMTHIEDLGWRCDLTYTTYRSGRESVRCRCERV